MKLTELQVLALDCQATGANPHKGHLLEIGWVKTCAAASVSQQTLPTSAFQVRLPAEVLIPPAVQRITGITKANSDGALAADDIRRKLSRAAREIAAADRMALCPAVIHYSRFEKPFLKDLYAHGRRAGAFPFQIICTHEIAKRLLPGLPRRGLRAVAGYFGHSVPPQRRCADHAVATAVIWQHFVGQLKAEHGIYRLEQLTRWLKHTPPRNRARRIYPMRRELRLNLPDKPGIYRMLRSNGDLLYIGKATSLKQRVNSYFRQKGAQAEHTLEMLSQAANLDVTRTASALEAAVLESDEIKQHSPPYNVALQKGARKLVFCSRDLQKCAPEPDTIHCIGPLPEGSIAAAMRAFAAWHLHDQVKTGDDFIKSGPAILGVPPAYAPQPDCMAEGLTIFGRHHRARLEQISALRIIAGLGHDLWHEQLKAIENARSAAAEEPDDQQLSSEGAPAWTPEAVARGIEHTIMRAALMVRRSRWLCLLSESCLAWEARNAGGARKNVLLFENGIAGLKQALPIEKETPLPTGCTKRLSKRQKIFDITTYERLRVVTTELRRLVAEGRQIEVRLRPQAILRRRQLARLLPWV